LTPTSNKDLKRSQESKYAIVVAIAKQARVLSEVNKNSENYRLSSMVSTALSQLIRGDLEIFHRAPGAEA
jgi:DNA-directed RNA polymerase subunit omega